MILFILHSQAQSDFLLVHRPRQTRYNFFDCTTKTETKSTEHTVNTIVCEGSYIQHNKRDTSKTHNSGALFIHIDKCMMTMLVMALFHIHITNTIVGIENLKFTCKQTEKTTTTITSTHANGQSATTHNSTRFQFRICVSFGLIQMPHVILFVYSIEYIMLTCVSVSVSVCVHVCMS